MMYNNLKINLYSKRSSLGHNVKGNVFREIFLPNKATQADGKEPSMNSGEVRG